jgi:hypothetical protein
VHDASESLFGTIHSKTQVTLADFETAQFLISLFTHPTTLAYVVMFEQSRIGNKDKLICCTCPHFMSYGSHACKHIYYLAREFNMLVVESHKTKLPATLEEVLNFVPYEPKHEPTVSLIDLTVIALRRALTLALHSRLLRASLELTRAS